MAHIPAQGQPWQQRPPQGPPGQAWPPLDIMGLADKAAQVLSGQQFMSHQHASANPNAPSLTEAELPPLCKLAIQVSYFILCFHLSCYNQIIQLNVFAFPPLEPSMFWAHQPRAVGFICLLLVEKITRGQCPCFVGDFRLL